MMSFSIFKGKRSAKLLIFGVVIVLLSVTLFITEPSSSAIDPQCTTKNQPPLPGIPACPPGTTTPPNTTGGPITTTNPNPSTSTPSSPTPAANLDSSGNCRKNTFFGLVPWYNYLSFKPSSCDFNFNFLGDGGSVKSDVPLVLLAIIDDLLRIAGIVAVFFVLAGGIRYITSQGSPDETAKAQTTIVNALIGLAVALVAVGVVSFIGKQFGA